nr:hypothetical protein [uncultured Cellulosilyticum sp.]
MPKEINYCSECIHCTDVYILIKSKKMHYCFTHNRLVHVSDKVCGEFEEEEYK